MQKPIIWIDNGNLVTDLLRGILVAFENYMML